MTDGLTSTYLRAKLDLLWKRQIRQIKNRIQQNEPYQLQYTKRHAGIIRVFGREKRHTFQTKRGKKEKYATCCVRDSDFP